MEHFMIKNLIKAAADLDAAGFIVEADLMDKIMEKIAGEPNFGFLSQKKTKAPTGKKPAKKATEEDADEDMLASLQGAADDGDEESEEEEDAENEESEESEYGDKDDLGDISEEDEEDGVTISPQECLEHCLDLSREEKCALMKALLDSIIED